MWAAVVWGILFLGAPDFRVVAHHEDGAENPELSEAISRALLASGVRVVLGGPSGQSCDHCVEVSITRGPGDRHRIAVERDGQMSVTLMHLPANVALLDRARALAVQIRLLAPENKRKPTLAKAVPVAPPMPLASSVSESSPPPPEEPIPDPAMKPVEKKPVEPPVVAVVVQKSPPLQLGNETLRPRWPYISLALGAASALSAGICAYLARDRHRALADRSQSLSQARQLKNEGESLQTASFVLAGAAVVGVTTGVIGFWRGRGKYSAYRPVVSVLPEGVFIALQGNVP